MSVVIYHNPRCSKSRQALQLLIDRDINPVIRQYIKNAPTKEEVSAILKLLNICPRKILRHKDALYKEVGFDNDKLTDDQLLDLIVQNPSIIERPIVINDDKAVIGRPPEDVLAII